MEDPKNIKDDMKENESPELKEELTDEELSGLSGGHEHVEPPCEEGCYKPEPF